MHTLSVRENPVVCLYVKALRYTYQIGSVFNMARQMAPCLLILEDIDTLVTEQMRSYFFNEVDGLGNNNGIMMIATTNHLDKLDGGLAKRPSRFDRKYAFPVPDRDERIMYCDYWRRKLQYNKKVDFPEKLSPAISDITEGFTFAYLKEAFVATLLALARPDEDGDDEDEFGEKITHLEDTKAGSQCGTFSDDDDITDLPLWVEIQKQIKVLREDMDASDEHIKPDNLPVRSSPNEMPPKQRLGKGISDLSFQAGNAKQDHLVKMRSAFNQRTGKRMPAPEKDSPLSMDTSPVKTVAGLLGEWRAPSVVDKSTV
jgi:ATPase family associated with various cellular activities (AAA)